MLVAILVLAVVSLLMACTAPEPSEPSSGENVAATEGENVATPDSPLDSGDPGKLVVYSPWSDVELAIAIPAFEEQTGIKVDVMSGGTGELVTRVEAEKDDPQGDVILGGSMGVFQPRIDLWEEYVSPENDSILDAYKNTTGYISPYNIVPTIILVNKNLIGDIEIKGWNDLLKPELKGKIAYADPAASSLSNVLLFNLLTVMGDGKDIDTGWEWVDKFCEQLDGKLLTGSSAVPKGVADGEYTVGLTHELYYATYLADNAPVEAIYPEEGSATIAGPIVIIKNAPNMDNAKLFVDYILGKDFQERYRDGHDVRSVRIDVSPPGTMPALETFKTIPETVCDADVQNTTLTRFKDSLYK
jgi:iron(III) transport system substrate-binding protein